MDRRGAAAGLLAALALAGCGGSGGIAGAVLLSIEFAPGAPPDRVAATRALDIAVDGAEQFTTRIPVNGELGRGAVTVRYRPGVKEGSLRFSATAADQSDAAIARGATQ